MLYWENEIETLRPNDMKRIQPERLKTTMDRAARSNYYSNLFSSSGNYSKGLHHIEDIVNVSYTTKQDLHDSFPYGFQNIITRLK
jgi:phenylacetate-CoA ligase